MDTMSLNNKSGQNSNRIILFLIIASVMRWTRIIPTSRSGNLQAGYCKYWIRITVLSSAGNIRDKCKNYATILIFSQYAIILWHDQTKMPQSGMCSEVCASSQVHLYVFGHIFYFCSSHSFFSFISRLLCTCVHAQCRINLSMMSNSISG